MAFDAVLAELQSRKQKALAMGGEVKIKQRESEGVLNARQRVDLLLDQGTFIESGMFATSYRSEMRERTPADGKVAGLGKIEGRIVGVVSNDFTVLGASSSVTNGKKIRHMRQVANERGVPLIFLSESSGARMPDRMGAAGRAILGQDPTEYQRLRKSPWVSALLGPCFGSSTWYACMSDFVVMRNGATMAVASSRVASMAINQKIDSEALGGWKLQSEKIGRVDLVVNSDQEAILAVQRFLSFFPSHAEEAPPVHLVAEGSGDFADQILNILPEERSKTYNVKKIIELIIDRNSFFELKGRFGKSIVTALTRINGYSVGVIANNPMFKGGAIDVDACRKAISFLVLCDSFNIPIVSFVDQPGFLIGLEGEERGAPGHIINWMNALSLVTVPKISIIMRKSYGQAYLNMGGGRNSDEVVCWPMADLGFMAPEVAVNVLYGISRDSDPVRFDELALEISRDSSGWGLAELYEAQSVIDPRETRNHLVALLEVYRSGPNRGVGQHLLGNWPTSY